MVGKEIQDEGRYLWLVTKYKMVGELSWQGEQRWFKLFAALLRDSEDSQTGENCSSQGVNEQKQKQEFLWSEDGEWD